MPSDQTSPRNPGQVPGLPIYRPSLVLIREQVPNFRVVPSAGIIDHQFSAKQMPDGLIF
jgi:hypothetical protein